MSSLDLCKQDFETGVFYFNYIIPIACGVSALLLLAPTYQFLKAYIKNELKTFKPLFYIGIIFFISCFATNILLMLTSIFTCNNVRLYPVIANIFAQFYVAQTLLFLGQLYYRLHNIFRDSSFSLSKCTNVTFWTYFIFTTLLLIFDAIIVINYPSMAPQITALVGVLVVLMAIFLDSLFVYKLFAVFNGTKQNAKHLVNTVTKTSLLTFISTFITILTFVFLSLAPLIQSVHWNFARNLISIADVDSNVLCIFLSYTHFNEYYDKIFPKCHSCCRKMWRQCFANKEELEVPSQEISDVRHKELEVEITENETFTH